MGVERSIENIRLSDKQLLAMVSKAFPHCKKLDEWKILSGGALNTIYQFKIDQNAFVLRLYARDRAHCKTERMIHELIDGHVQTPQLIYADESYNPWAYSIFTFIPGEHISEVSKEKKVLLSYELGHLLATIHQFKLPVAGLFGDGMTVKQIFKKGSSPYFEETFSLLSSGKYVRARLGDKLADKALAFIQRNKDYFPIIEDTVSLIHSDFKPVNLLYHNERVYALDWEFSHAGIGILDFAILVRHRDQFPYNEEALVKGYTDFGGKLPKNWFRSALITDFINIVTLIDSPPERPQLFEQVKLIIQNTIGETL